MCAEPPPRPHVVAGARPCRSAPRTTSPAATPPPERCVTRFTQAPLAGARRGLLAGALDITYAWVFWAVKAGVLRRADLPVGGRGPPRRGQLQGRVAATAVLGLALHFFIATTMSVTYYLVARRRPLLRDRPSPAARLRPAALRDHELHRRAALGRRRRRSQGPTLGDAQRRGARRPDRYPDRAPDSPGAPGHRPRPGFPRHGW